MKTQQKKKRIFSLYIDLVLATLREIQQYEKYDKYNI
jgi:hypothetical protein